MFNYKKGPNEYRDEIIIPTDKRDTTFKPNVSNAPKFIKNHTHTNTRPAESKRRNTMENINCIKNIVRLYESTLAIKKDEDYTVNQAQMAKFIELWNFFVNQTKKSSGSIEAIELSPKVEHGGITACFTVFDVYGKELRHFCELMSYASAVTIDATTDGICISVTVPEVFVPIGKNRDNSIQERA